MEHLERIQEIEDRARVVNVTMTALCERAGVSTNLLYRWRTARSSPTYRVFDRAMSALSLELDTIERGIFKRLAPKFRDTKSRAA